MIFRVGSADFLSLVERCFSVCSTTNLTPILQNVYVRTTSSGLTAVGGDGDIYLITSTDNCLVRQHGSFIMPPKCLEVLKQVNEEFVEVHVDKNVAYFSTSTTKWDIRVEHEEYKMPDFSKVKFDTTFEREKLISTLTKARTAIASEIVRPAFMFIDMSGGYVQACDGSRLHRVPFPSSSNLLLSGRTANELIKYAKKARSSNIFFSDTYLHYVFQVDKDFLFATKHKIEYPDVDSFLVRPAKSNNQKLTVNRKQIISAIKQVAITADDDTKYLQIDLTQEVMYLRTSDKYFNQSYVSIPVDWRYPSRTLGVKHINFVDALNIFDEDEIDMFFGLDSLAGKSSIYFSSGETCAVVMQLRQEFAMRNAK